MNLVTTGVILVFCLAGALVAYVADNLGRYLGKKRLSIFGLRPRHTGTLITTAAGFVIPLLTTVLLAASSQELRTILREGTNLISQRDQAEANLNAAKTNLTKVEKNLSSTQSMLAGTTKKVTEAERQAKTAVTQKQQAEAALKLLGEQTRSLRAQLEPLRAKIAVASQSLRAVQAKNAALQTKASELTRTNAQQMQSYRIQSQRLREADEQYRRMDSEIRKLETAVAKLEEDRRTISGLRDRDVKELENLRGQITAKSDELAQLNSTIEDLASKAMDLQQGAVSARTRGFILAMNEEVARIVTRPGMSYPEADRTISNALREARQVSERKGAVKIGALDSASFRDRKTENGLLTASEQVRQLREDLVNQVEPQVLILQSVWNTFAGESVPLRYSLYPNRKIYSVGQVISETRIDGIKPKEAILAAIVEWLTVGVPAKVAADGIIPASGRTDQFGAVTQAKMMQVVDALKQEGRLIRLQLIATADTTSAGPLKFEFRLR